MIDHVVRAILWLLVAYASMGIAFTVLFHQRGAAKVDQAAAASGWAFRLFITPGLIALWPIMAGRWRSAAVVRPGQDEMPNRAWPRRSRAVHRYAIQALCVLVPVAAGAALATRLAPVSESMTMLGEIPRLPALVHDAVPLFPERLTSASLRSNVQRYQIELTIEVPLERPAVGVYWSPKDTGDAVISESTFLGTIWGPAVRRFTLPTEYSPGLGSFHLYAALDAEILSSVNDPFTVRP